MLSNQACEAPRVVTRCERWPSSPTTRLTLASSELSVWFADPEALLQLAEAGALTVKGHDLAVHHETGRRLGRQRVAQFRIGRADVELIAGEQPDLIAGPVGQAPLAVELPLIHPGRVGEPLLGQGRQFWLQPVRQPGA